MILSFLEPFEIRGVKAPYLWIYYKQLQDFGIDDIVYIASEDYFLNPEFFMKQKRWEFLESVQKNNKYTIPSYKKILASNKEVIKDIYKELKEKFKDNISIWKFLLTNRYEPLEKELEKIINKYNVEFIVTWSNNASLQYISSKYNIPLIHNEKAPLREPLYYNTAYFDFKGVNGNTESEKRFNLFQVKELLEIDDLRNLFLKNKETVLHSDFQYEIGVALQVEDDSNLIAYNNGYDNLKLLNEVSYFYDKSNILIRNHPLSGIKIGEKYGNIDNSKNSIEFIGKCEKIATINSSVGFEALMWGKEVCAKGDSPYYFFVSNNCKNRMKYEKNYKKFMNFFLMNYLIPYDFLFDKEYYKWRIEVKNEEEIFCRHKSFWLSKNNLSLSENFITKKIYFLTIEEKNNQIKNYQSEIEEKNNQIKNYQSEIEEKNNQIKNYQSEIEEKNNQIKNYQSVIEEKNSQLQKKNKEIKKLLNEVLMYSTSKSWKVTRILRYFKKLIKR